METDKERTARLENMVATTQLRLALHSSGWHYTAQVGPEDREERRGKNGLDMILI